MRTLLYAVILLHHLLILAVFTAFFTLPFYEPWYVALPLDLLIVNFSTNRFVCKLTDLENGLRQKLGLKRIGGFIGHYYVKPIRRLWRT